MDRDTQHFIEKIQRDNPDIDLDELDMLAYEHEQKLRSEFGVKDDFKYTDEFKDNVEKIQYPYNIDTYMLIAPKKQYPSHSLFPSLESIQNWQKTKT